MQFRANGLADGRVQRRGAVCSASGQCRPAPSAPQAGRGGGGAGRGSGGRGGRGQRGGPRVNDEQVGTSIGAAIELSRHQPTDCTRALRTRRTPHPNLTPETACHPKMKVTWDNPVRPDPCVAIVGGGLSGLVCGQALARKGVRCVVFDTGEHTVGGRLATRAAAAGSFRKAWVPPALAGARLVFDHAAQFFTATDPRCAAAGWGWWREGGRGEAVLPPQRTFSTPAFTRIGKKV
jgi:hypothetical protein